MHRRVHSIGQPIECTFALIHRVRKMTQQYFVSRHAGAHEWAARQGFEVQVVSHFDPEVVESGDVVIGTLPVQLACRVCERGGEYLHLTLDLRPEDRGQEISADRMQDLGARVERFVITRG